MCTVLKERGEAIALDFWTDFYNNVSYMVVTTNYLEEWEMCKVVIFVSAYDPAMKQDAANVHKFLDARLNDVGLKERDTANITFVTDAGANTVAALKLQNRPAVYRITSAGHRLNIVSKTAFKTTPLEYRNLSEIITSCEKLVRHIETTNLQHLLNYAVKQEV